MQRGLGRISRGLTLLLIAGTFLPARLPAQTKLVLQPGDKLRLTRKAFAREVLLFQGCRGDTLIVSARKNPRALEVARSDIDHFEVLVPRSQGRGALHGAGVGSLIGGAVGFVASFILGVAAGSDESSLDMDLLAVLPLPEGVVLGGIIGSFIGLGVPGKRWAEVKPPIQLDCGPGPAARTVPARTTRNIGMSYPIGGVEPERRESSAEHHFPHLGECSHVEEGDFIPSLVVTYYPK